MKTNVLCLAAAAVLFSVPALAQQYDQRLYQQQQYDQRQVAVAQPPPGAPQQAAPQYDEGRDVHEARIATRGGHYELRDTQKWEEARYESVFVPGNCFGRNIVKVCSPGHYEQRLVPGRYVAAREYVWVANHPGHGWGRFDSHRR